MSATSPPDRRGLLLDEGDPRATPRTYRRALGQFATGISVITADAGDGPALVTVNSFASVSLDPPLVLWSLRRASRSLGVFQAASHFAVNVLSADQVEVATRHARSAPAEDPSRHDGARGRGEAPLLPGVAASFECRRTAEHDGGDHVIFLGEVEHYRCFDRAGLLFSQGHYGLAIDHPQAAPRVGFEQTDVHPLDDFLIPLLLRAYMALSAEFDGDREALGLDLDQSKVLSWLAAHPGASAAAIAGATLLGVTAAEDSVAALIAKGLAAPRLPGAVVITDEGRQVVAALLGRASAFEAKKLSGVDEATVAAVRRVLVSLAKGY